MILRPSFTLDAQRIQATLRILATTDLHSHLLPYDYFTDQPLTNMGLALTASLIRMLRGAEPNCLLLDDGDFLQGGPLSDWVAEQDRTAQGQPNPMIAAMNALGYDAGTLGNHEFNYGTDFLRRALAQAEFPVVSANITTAQGATVRQDTHFVPPYVILDRALQTADGSERPIRIGIIGFSPPQIALWERLSLGNEIGTRDIVEAARVHVPRLREAGADIVIALCHSGIGPDQHVAGMENAAVPLAAVPGIDAILAGHTHQVFPGPDIALSPAVDPIAGTLHGKPAVMAGFHGSHLGVIDLLLDHDGDRWQAVAHAVRAEPIAMRDTDGVHPLVKADAQLSTIGEASHAQVLGDIRRPIGETSVPLHSYFSLIGPDASLQVVADAQRARAIAVLKDGPWEGLPTLSAVAPFKVGGRGGPQHFLDIPPGPLVRRHASELYLYPNAFCVLAMPGAKVQDWLERSASIYLQIVAGMTDQPLIDPAFPAYNFDLLDGVTYVIDPTQPARHDTTGRIINPNARRIIDLRLNGVPIDPDGTVLIATNGYRAGGGGGFAAAVAARVVHQGEAATRDVILDHMRGPNPVDPIVSPTWRFRDLPGTSAWFDTGLGARSYDKTRPRLTPVMETPEGFQRYLLQFSQGGHAG